MKIIKADINDYIRMLEKDIRPDIDNQWLIGMVAGLKLAVEVIQDHEEEKHDYINNQT